MTDTAFQLEDKVIEREKDPSRYAFRVEPTGRQVTVTLGGVVVARSRRVQLLHESKHMPVYYFPAEDVRMDLLAPSGRSKDLPVRGTARYFDITVGQTRVSDGAWIHESPEAPAEALRGMVAFYWAKMDRWFEEDDEVYKHPRDPYHRVDVLSSSRHVQVVMLGQVVAETRRPRLLFETGLPTRYYIPWADVRSDLFVASTTSSICPYKGAAEYWSLQIGDQLVKDIAWVYRHPIPECPKIENLVCFYDEQVDGVIVDGERQPRPQTAWSKAPLIRTVAGS
ncbi:DUF427 domain-containing protein [Microbacterium sp. 2FI]|uniref:DUF427 domain-containing protein n=1 Tax=Microbacterium sp. 2FI TaxID=2502193 RepID=UPI0010F8A6DD|nr:DUF427 domain-containing protein [Microbacterium sp. 2FI]